jgi:hypothetical protein
MALRLTIEKIGLTAEFRFERLLKIDKITDGVTSLHGNRRKGIGVQRGPDLVIFPRLRAFKRQFQLRAR